MRKVKIPTSMNPFVVHVNGEKYVYPAGTEQEVTDAVANVIDAYIKKENQQPDPTESPFSTSWNDLKDKPFGETTVKGDTLTWDGNTEGLVSCTNAPFYKVSDAIPTRANCANGITITAFGGVETPVDGETAQGAFMEDGAAFFDVVFIIPCDNYDADGMVFPKAGVYFSNDGDGGMVSSFTIHNYTGFETTTIKPIDTKYLPEQYMPILTSPSGKKFKLSVDDSGVLSATEV